MNPYFAFPLKVASFDTTTVLHCLSPFFNWNWNRESNVFNSHRSVVSIWPEPTTATQQCSHISGQQLTYYDRIERSGHSFSRVFRVVWRGTDPADPIEYVTEDPESVRKLRPLSVGAVDDLAQAGSVAPDRRGAEDHRGRAKPTEKWRDERNGIFAVSCPVENNFFVLSMY